MYLCGRVCVHGWTDGGREGGMDRWMEPREYSNDRELFQFRSSSLW